MSSLSLGDVISISIALSAQVRTRDDANHIFASLLIFRNRLPSQKRREPIHRILDDVVYGSPSRALVLASVSLFRT